MNGSKRTSGSWEGGVSTGMPLLAKGRRGLRVVPPETNGFRAAYRRRGLNITLIPRAPHPHTRLDQARSRG
jgi:hypothetical protein